MLPFQKIPATKRCLFSKIVRMDFLQSQRKLAVEEGIAIGKLLRQKIKDNLTVLS